MTLRRVRLCTTSCTGLQHVSQHISCMEERLCNNVAFVGSNFQPMPVSVRTVGRHQLQTQHLILLLLHSHHLLKRTKILYLIRRFLKVTSQTRRKDVVALSRSYLYHLARKSSRLVDKFPWYMVYPRSVACHTSREAPQAWPDRYLLPTSRVHPL